MMGLGRVQNSRIKFNKAFTLIELLLVIAVASILAAVGIMSYRRYFEANRIDKVAISMQHVLEAAMAFYVDRSKWPQNHDCDGSGVIQQDFLNNYLPNRSYESYYGTNFCWQSAGDTQRLFWVAVQIPEEGDETLSIAKRLAARLPNAVATSDPDASDPTSNPCTQNQCYVRAEITVPGMSSNAVSDMTLAAIGDCRTNQIIRSGSATCTDTSDPGNQKYRIDFKACPAGMKPNLRISPNFIQFPTSGVGWAISQMQAASAEDCTEAADVDGNEQCNAVVNVNVCTDILKCAPKNLKSFGGSSVGASYVVSCNRQERMG